MRVKHLRHVLVVGALCVALPGIVSPQSNTAQLTGRITDSSGGIIQGAQVIAINVDRGTQRKTTTNESGYYTCPLLHQGNYRIAVAMEGFKPMTRSGIRLGIQQVVRVDFVLELGEVTQALDVIASPAALNTENAQLGTCVPAKTS